MKKSKIAFLTTIFPASKPYLPAFFKSLQKQTKKDFDIIVINDGVISYNPEKYKPLNIVEFKTNSKYFTNTLFKSGTKTISLTIG